MEVKITNNDVSQPAAPQRIADGPEHPRTTALRDELARVYRVLVRLVDTGHMDETTTTHLNTIAATTEALHTHLNQADAAWAAAHAVPTTPVTTESDG